MRIDYQNMQIVNNYPNLMTISLSHGKTNNKNNKIFTNKIASINIDKNLNKKNKYNYMSFLSNNHLGGYKTFFNKNKANDKYNYDINTNYFKEELQKYNSNPLKNYYNNVIDENDEYINNSSNNNEINSKNIYNNNKYIKKKNNMY